MDGEFWRSRWSTGRIGFHKSEVHPDLLQRRDAWLDSGSRVLVPLCGKTLDLAWLAERVPTVGVELVPTAVEQLHAEQSIEAEVGVDGSFRAWRSPNLTVLEGDVFDLSEAHVAGVDRVWDRAALVALRPDQRTRYVRHLRDLLDPGARVLLNTFAYDPSVMSGPPHSVTEEEVRDHYAGADVDVVYVDEAVDPAWEARGHRWFRKTLWLITL